MSEMVINSSTIKAQAENLSNLNVQFQSQVNELKNIESTLNSSWDGEARVTFHNAFQSDVDQMDNFFKVISQYVATLMNIAARYEQAENKNIDIASTRTYR